MDYSASPRASPGKLEADKFPQVDAHDHSGSDFETIADEEPLQDGVKKAQGVTLVWTTGGIIAAYFLIYLIFYVNSLQQQIQNNLSYYVTSEFSQLPLTATASVLSSIIGAAMRLPIAKLIDIWGRAEGFLLMVFLTTIGLIMMAGCQNVTTYAAAQVFYWVGFDGMGYVLDVFIADTAALKNRPWLFAFTTSPYIINTFIGPLAAQSIYTSSGSFRWGFGLGTIITPVMCAPLSILWFVYYRKAVRLGKITRTKSERSFGQSVVHYLIEFDVVGIILIVAAFCLFLLPFSLAKSASDSWASGHIIAMIVIGFLLFFAFAGWERWLAPKSFIPWNTLLDRTVLNACFLGSTLFISFYPWDSYFTPYMRVAYDLDITRAGYMYNIYNIGSCFWGIVVGFIIRGTGDFKWTAMAAIPVQIIGTGLMIYFRGGHMGIGFQVMCQVFIAFAGGTLVICQQIAVMSAVEQNQIAVVLALLSMFTSIGGAVGQSLAGGIYTNTFADRLLQHLPADALKNAAAITGDITVQLSYPMGSPVRDAIIATYSDVMRYECIASVAILPLGFLFVSLWHGVNIKDIEKNVGHVV